MKKRSILLAVCVCGMFLCGCSAQEVNTPENAQNTQAGTNHTEDIRTEENQTGDVQTDAASGSEAATTQISGAGITEQDALAAALAHADVDESKITSKRVKKDYEDGKEVYDVEFYAGGKEYDYEISVADGSILKADFEIEDDFADAGTGQGSNGEISEEKAKEIALAKVPGAVNIEIERDIEDGKPVYEGEIHYNHMEYEFEIDAATGKILRWEEDED